MGMAKIVKTLLLERDMTLTDLAGKLGKTVQNMSAKLRRDNLSEKELQDIAKACNATFVGGFILNLSLIHIWVYQQQPPEARGLFKRRRENRGI